MVLIDEISKIKFNTIQKELIKHQNLQLNNTKNLATLVGLSLEKFNLLAIDVKKTRDKIYSYFKNTIDKWNYTIDLL